jgi:hypothetical protein
MMRPIAYAAVALALVAGAAPAVASAPQAPSLPELYVQFFYRWKSEPKGLQVSELKVLNAGGDLRVLCGKYDLPGQDQRPFMVMGDDTPSVSAAWEPGVFPETDPLYGQVMQNLRYCQAEGAPVTRASWAGQGPA